MELDNIVKTLRSKNYIVYEQPNKLNIVGIRSKNETSETFDDYIAFFYYDESGKLKGKVCPATTDPSVVWLQSPMSNMGTAILKSGQYIDSHKVGIHRGKYQALVQANPVTVIRDNDRNSLLNFFATTETGVFGINIHRASYGKNNVEIIGLDSAGCQVFKNPPDFDEMMALARISSAKYGNSFTYTLIDEQDEVKNARNYLLIGGIFIAIGVYGYFLYKKMNK